MSLGGEDHWNYQIGFKRSLTSRVLQRLMAEAWRRGAPPPRSTPSLETALEVGRLLLNYVLSDPYVDVALVQGHVPRFAELNNEISDDVASRIDLAPRFFTYPQAVKMGVDFSDVTVIAPTGQ
jgi:hypothetical protein